MRPRDRALRRLEHRAPEDRPQELAHQPEELRLPARGARVAHARVRRARLRRRLPQARSAARPATPGGPTAARRGRRTSAGASTTRSRRRGSPPARARHAASTRAAASPTTRRSRSTTTTSSRSRLAPLLRIADLTLRRGASVLLEGASLTVHAGQKVGLVGANGSGKSSLFALMRGELHADAGEVDAAAAWVIAHVAQETPAVDAAGARVRAGRRRELREVEARDRAAEPTTRRRAPRRAASALRRDRRLQARVARADAARGPGLRRGARSARRSRASPAAGACA